MSTTTTRDQSHTLASLIIDATHGTVDAAGCGLWDDLRDYLPADVARKYDRAIAVANRALATSGRLADRCDMMVWHGRPIQD